jgi:cell wall-associated NlpC family hydrolase
MRDEMTLRFRWLRRSLLLVLVLAVAGAGAVSLAHGENRGAPAKTATAEVASAPAPDPTPAQVELPPLPESHARVVQPVAGGASGTAARTSGAAPRSAADDDDAAAPATGAAASQTTRSDRAFTGGSGAVNKATALGNGVALPPLEAPEAVRQIIQAGNAIARTPYIWGGGHGRWLDKGYDCSGSVSFALAAAGLLNGPLDSGHLMSWGQAGPGRWVTIYANAGHVFLEVAGIRFDTGAQRVTGSRWANFGRSTAGFVARHPAGL